MDVAEDPVDSDPLSSGLPSVCLECDRDFFFHGLLEKHQVDVHDKEDNLFCKNCNTSFKRKMNLVLHWRSPAHRGYKFIGCDICDAFTVANGFPDEAALADHTSKVHGEGVIINGKDQDDFFCPLCQKKFSHRKGMIEHLQVLHGEHLFGDLLGEKGSVRQQLLNKLLFKCPDCDKSFRVKSTLNRHREKFHDDYSHWTKNPNRGKPPPQALSYVQVGRQRAEESQQKSPAARPNNPIVNQSNGTTCRFCQKSFTRPSVLNVHMEMVHTAELEKEKNSSAAEVDDEEYEEIEELDDDEELGQQDSEVIEIAPDFYHSSGGEDEKPEITNPQAQQQKQQLSLLRMTLSNREVPRFRPILPKLPGHQQQEPRTLPPSLTVTKTMSMSHVSGRSPTKPSNSTGLQVPQQQHLFRTRLGDSSSEEDEGLPRHANIIVKRTGSSDVDHEWIGVKKRQKVSLENPKAGGDDNNGSTRISTRIKTKQTKSEMHMQSQQLQEGEEGASESKSDTDTETIVKVEDVIKEEERELYVSPKPRDPSELVEPCIYDDCDRKFYGYFSMMRHVAFTHRRERTMELMKLESMKLESAITKEPTTPVKTVANPLLT